MTRCQLRSACFVIAIVFLSAASTHAQLPFYTDDADTTAKGKFHIELSNEHDWLQRSSLPGIRQNTSVFTINYGLTSHIELGVNAPLIKIFNERDSMLGNPTGVGDTQFGVKIRVFTEHEDSKLPAATVVFYAEAPTGSTRKQLGSGLVDYWLYGVLQKSLTKRTTGRLNSGILFAGNSSTGLVGIVTNNYELSRGQLMGQVGGGYAFTQNFELTFGVLGGRFPASPRAGVQVGFAYDFK